MSNFYCILFGRCLRAGFGISNGPPADRMTNVERISGLFNYSPEFFQESYKNKIGRIPRFFILHSSFENTLTDFYNPFLQVVKFFPGDMGRFFLEAELMGDGTVN